MFSTNRPTQILAIFLLLSILAGCIRPEQVPTATPTGGDTVVNFSTMTPAGGSTTTAPVTLTDSDRLAIEAYVETQIGRPVTSGTIDIWRTIPFLNEGVISFSYTNPSGLLCVGVVMAFRDIQEQLTIFNGESHCATEPGTAVAGSWLLVSYNNPSQLLIATVGQFPNPPEAILAGRVIYSDGTILDNVSIDERNRLFNTRADVFVATQVQFIGQTGNIIADVIIPPR